MNEQLIRELVARRFGVPPEDLNLNMLVAGKIVALHLESRLSALQQSHERLLEALEVYMSQFGQALEAHGINYGPAQIAADQQARAAIAEATPEGDK